MFTWDNMLSYKIEGWDEKKQEWYMQEGGNNPIASIMKSWKWWTTRFPDSHYRLALIITQDKIIDDTDWK